MGIYLGLAPSLAFVNIEDKNDKGTKRYDTTMVIPFIAGYQHNFDDFLLGIEGAIGGSFFIMNPSMLENDMPLQGHIGASIGYKLAKNFSAFIIGGASFQSVQAHQYKDSEGKVWKLSDDIERNYSDDRKKVFDKDNADKFWLINPYLGLRLKYQVARHWNVFADLRYGFRVTDKKYAYVTPEERPIGQRKVPLGKDMSFPKGGGDTDSKKVGVNSPNFSLMRGTIGVVYEFGGAK